MSTEFDIAKVYLMLGGKCNYHCRYCLQEKMKPLEYSSADMESSLGYIRHLSSIRPNQLNKITVIFWGGEPLLYLKTIKEVVNRLGDVVDYAMVSNGSLLDGRTVDFLNENNIQYVLSNDGPRTEKVRLVNLLENDVFLRFFRKVKSKSVNAVISAYNQDYYALWKYFDEKIPGIPIHTELLECTWDMPEDLYGFDLAAYQETMNQIVIQARKDLLAGKVTREVRLLHPYTSSMMNIADRLEKGDTAFLAYPRCQQMRIAMNIDLRGNVYACHNFFDRIGTVEDEYELLLEKYDARYGLNEVCKKCTYALFCRGGCPYVKDSPGKRHCCEVKKIFILACLNYIKSFEHVLEKVEL